MERSNVHLLGVCCFRVDYFLLLTNFREDAWRSTRRTMNPVSDCVQGKRQSNLSAVLVRDRSAA